MSYVIGIDFGSSSTVVGVKKRGQRAIECLLNESSNRLTPSKVGFDDNDNIRILGEAAKTGELRYFRNTIPYPKRLIGKNFDVFQKELALSGACKYKEGPKGEVLVDVRYRNTKYSFSSEQLVGMYLAKIKLICENGLGGALSSEVVISVPGYWTDYQRRALLVAAQIAGLRVSRLINDLSAAATGYGFYLRDMGEEKRNVMFVDVGGANTQVSIFEYSTPKKDGKAHVQCKIVGSEYNENLGGRNIDFLLADFFAAKFQKKTGLDLKSNQRAFLKLLVACEKVKKSINLNSTASISHVSIMEDRDLQEVITKEEYIGLLSPLMTQLVDTVSGIFDKTGLSIENLHSVEWLGGGMRVTEFQKALSNSLGVTIKGSMNAEEAVAEGCAYQCVILSPQFRTTFDLKDSNELAIQLSWQTLNDPEDEKISSVPLVKPYAPYKKNKTNNITFTRRECKPFSVRLDYLNPENLPEGTNPHIATYDIPSVPSYGDNIDTDVRLKIKLDISGISNLIDAEAIEKKEYEVEVEVKPEVKPEPQPEKESEKTNGENTDTPMPDVEEPEKTTEETEKSETDTPMPDVEEKPKTILKKKVRTDYHKIECVANLLYTGDQQLKEWKTLEKDMAENDLEAILKANAKNNLEEYIFETKYSLETSWKEYATEEETQSAINLLNNSRDWLENEGWDENREAYESKLKECTTVGNPVYVRYVESGLLPSAIKSFLDSIDNYRTKATSELEEYSHIKEEEMKKITDEIAHVEELYLSKIETQNNLAKTDDPVIFAKDLNARTSNLATKCEKILSTPKPKPPKVEEKPEEKDEEDKMKTDNEETPEVDIAEVDTEEDKMKTDNESPVEPTEPEAMQMDVD